MLAWQLNELRSTSSTDVAIAGYRMILCSITAWSMCDWVFEGIPEDKRVNVCEPANMVGVKAFRGWVKKKSPALCLCRFIADAAKHWNIGDRPNPDIQTVHFKYEDKDGVSAGFWVVIDADGLPRNCEALIEGAIDFWKKFLIDIDSIKNSRVEL